MWQILYCALATNSWRFLGRPDGYPVTWCTRCSRHQKEDIGHCLVECPVSEPVWTWCESLLQWVSNQQTHAIRLLPPHILVAQPLPDHWDVPNILWHIVRAVVAWHIWKDRCSHCPAGNPFVAQAVIAKSWHRIAVYLRLDWQQLRRLIY